MTLTPDPSAADPADPFATHGPLPYGTPDAPRVAVRGEALLEVEPEIARIGVAVTARDADRRAALEALTLRNGEVLELLRGYGEAVEEVSTGAFSVAPEPVEKGRRERVRAYRGRVRTAVTVGDFTALGELVGRLAEVEMAEVDGPWWALRPDSPAYRRARQQAVREAVTRAREYAEALGAGLVALVELADVGAEGPGAGAVPRARAAGFGGPVAPGGPPPELDLEPQPQSVRAQVNARFVMSRPAL